MEKKVAALDLEMMLGEDRIKVRYVFTHSYETTAAIGAWRFNFPF